MSRLDSHIHQKIAQRDSINLAARWLGETEGVIVEFGLSTGRSFSHLRERFPGREIFCFDRLDKSLPQSCPPAGYLFLGEFTGLLADPAVHARFAGRVILAHIDIGCGGPEDEVMPEFVMDRIHRWLKPGAIVLSDQDLTLAPAWQLERLDTTAEVEHADRYYSYRRRAT
ncbi:MAG: hypothetical protein HYY54_05340 [candidate division NC10 bacterium]|nr:hypothetical protein [candidate division NC10 bacterium]